ncbi:MAG: SurA N-terminal domain-containing protein [Candidatus Omnitrophota bacterium]
MVLNILRSKKFARRVMLGLLILIIPAFVLWGAGGITKKKDLVGIINNHKIYEEDLAKSREGIKVQLLFSYYGNFDAMTALFKNRLFLNPMAWERLIFLTEAYREKIKISDRETLSTIAPHPLFQKDGVFDKSVYAYILRNTLHMDGHQFEELVRENLRAAAFQRSLMKDITASSAEALSEYKKTNDKVVLSYLFIEKALFKNQVVITNEEEKEYYDKNTGLFFEPAKIEIEYLDVPYFSSSEKNTALRKIETIHPYLSGAGKDFKLVAKDNSLHCAATGAFSRDDVIPNVPFFKEFYETSFRLKKGEVSDPIFFSSGNDTGTIYVLRKKEEFPQKRKNFSEARDEIKESLTEQKSVLLAEEKGGALYQKIIDENLSLEKISEENNEKITKTDSITVEDYIENIGPADKIVSSALKATPGEILAPLTVKNGVFIARIDAILPADPEKFEKEKETIQNKILKGKQMNALGEWLNKNSFRFKLAKSLEAL